MKLWQFVMLCALIVATGTYVVNGADWQEARTACKKYREWVRFQNNFPRTPVGYRDSLMWKNIISEHGCKELEIIKEISEPVGQKNMTWPEYLKSLQDAEGTSG